MDARANPDRLYHAPMKLGEPIAATGAIGKIVGLAEGSRWKVGDLVSIRSSSWSEYLVVPESALTAVDQTIGPASAYLGFLGGLTAQTAYWGLTDVRKIALPA